jgi:hypothetical protein
MGGEGGARPGGGALRRADLIWARIAGHLPSGREGAPAPRLSMAPLPRQACKRGARPSPTRPLRLPAARSVTRQANKGCSRRRARAGGNGSTAQSPLRRCRRRPAPRRSDRPPYPC